MRLAACESTGFFVDFYLCFLLVRRKQNKRKGEKTMQKRGLLGCWVDMIGTALK